MRRRKAVTKPEERNLLRLRTLVRKALAQETPEPERASSAMALARELARLGFLQDDAVALGLTESARAGSGPTGLDFQSGRAHVRRQVIIEPVGQDTWSDVSDVTGQGRKRS